MTEEAPKKRRWWFWALFPLAGLILLAVAFKKPLIGKFIRWKINPGKPFSSFTPPPAPLYSKPASWGALPSKKDFADYSPTGVVVPKGPKNADVFFIHPTTYISGKSWNAPLTDSKAMKRIHTAVLKHQASAFNACCRVYAPTYRQATLYFAIDFEPNGRQAIDLAYSDIVRSFTHYIKRWNKGRPFIIAGHSQGSLHALRLLEEHIVRTKLRKQLVAAYIVGMSLQKDKLKRTLAPLHACQHATDTGCVISWMSMDHRGDPSRYNLLPRFYPLKGYEDVKGRPHICTNPINWKTDGTPATYAQHLGAVRYKRGKGPIDAPQVHTVKGRCDKGAMRLVKSRIKRGFRSKLPFFPKGDFHIYDYNLFYMNIRQNAVDRVAAFVKARAKPTPARTPTPRSPAAPIAGTKASPKKPPKTSSRPVKPTPTR